MRIDELTERVFDAASDRDAGAAVSLVQDHRRDGESVDQVLAALTGVQRRVGERWYTDEWSVADEHAATAVVDAALAALEASMGLSVQHPRSTAVVVACPEGEWHALPARMLATGLRALGGDVVFLGASMPADHLARYVEANRPDIVALSVSTALAFCATARVIDALHPLEVPVVLGGRALGGSERRARALGADGWSRDAAGVLAAPRFPLAAELATRQRQERELVVLGLEIDRPEMVEAAMAVLAERIPAMARFDERQLARTRGDLDDIARYAEAAILVDDPAVLVEFVDWLGPLLAAREVPDGALDASMEALVAVCTDDRLRDVLVRVRSSSS